MQHSDDEILSSYRKEQNVKSFVVAIVHDPYVEFSEQLR
jgi:hypothetical protein